MDSFAKPQRRKISLFVMNIRSKINNLQWGNYLKSPVLVLGFFFEKFRLSNLKVIDTPKKIVSSGISNLLFIKILILIFGV